MSSANRIAEQLSKIVIDEENYDESDMSSEENYEVGISITEKIKKQELSNILSRYFDIPLDKALYDYAVNDKHTVELMEPLVLDSCLKYLKYLPMTLPAPFFTLPWAPLEEYMKIYKSFVMLDNLEYMNSAVAIKFPTEEWTMKDYFRFQIWGCGIHLNTNEYSIREPIHFWNYYFLINNRRVCYHCAAQNNLTESLEFRSYSVIAGMYYAKHRNQWCSECLYRPLFYSFGTGYIGSIVSQKQAYEEPFQCINEKMLIVPIKSNLKEIAIQINSKKTCTLQNVKNGEIYCVMLEKAKNKNIQTELLMDIQESIKLPRYVKCFDIKEKSYIGKEPKTVSKFTTLGVYNACKYEYSFEYFTPEEKIFLKQNQCKSSGRRYKPY